MEHPRLIADGKALCNNYKWKCPIQAVEGGLLILHNDGKDKILKVELTETGLEPREIHEPEVQEITGFIQHNAHLYVIHRMGAIEQITEQANKGKDIKNIQIKNVRSLVGGIVDNDQLLLLNCYRNEVITYNLKTYKQSI